MKTHLLIVMHVWVLLVLCFGYAVNADGRLTRREGASKHASPADSAKLSEKSNRNQFQHETRDKRTPQPKPQILLRNLPDNILTKRQFLPLVPDIPTREFGPRREFEQTLLPTPRLIRPLVLEPRISPLERGIIDREPIDLHRRPFLGQGILNPQLPPHRRRHFLPFENAHRPLLRDVPRFHLQSELEQPRHVFMEPHSQGLPLESFHRPLIPEAPHLLPLQPELEPQLESSDSLHYGSLGDTPLLDLPQRHHLAEGYMAPHLLGNLEPHIRHHYDPTPLSDSLAPAVVPQESLVAEQPRHYYPLHHFQEHTEPSIAPHFEERVQPEAHHHLAENFEQPSEPVAAPEDGTEGDDSIETMMNELNRHKKRKAWVTDVNIYDKKNKDEDVSKFLDSDDIFDDLNSDPCSNRPCKNGGLCRGKDGGGYECTCKRKFKGKHCTVRSRCNPNPCYNRGKCTETVSGFECSCAIGYKGKRCMDTNHCLPNPCMNDGTCNESPEGFVCSCREGLQGKTCEVRRTACNPNPCLNNAQCILDGSVQYKCICLEGFSGRTCDSFGTIGEKLGNSAQRSDIAVPTPTAMACINNPCMNNALCQPDATSAQGFKCVCVAEYKGILCEEKTCKCLNNGFCVSDGGNSKCICKAGYAGNFCDKHTQCNEDTCLHGGICIEETGAFKCKCDDGYKGDRCEAVDRCSPNPCLHGGVCKDLGDMHKCECPNTYKGKQCEDFNFCFPNPCRNGGTCFGYSGGFQCDCPNGFLGKSCENKQYCMSNPCKNGAQCVEVPNSFKCMCGAGFSGNSCEVHNFCGTNPCRNGGTCQNKATSFTCTCTERFLGETCETFNQCSESPCKNGGKCEMKPHGEVQCVCTTGFTGPRCEQMDECQPNPCQNEGACLNNPGGGFNCNCKEGYRGLTCLDVDPCHPNPCTHGICSEINGGYVCNCTLGFRGPVCAEIDRCTPNPCQHGASCQEINGGVGYVCQCPIGYKGQICDMKDPCNPSPCQHDSKCLETVTGSGFQCTCSSGWMGERCGDSDPCFPDPCQHGGNCLHGGKAGFNCNCTQGFKGSTCEKVDLCTPNPCRFGSHCLQTDEESYQCVKNLCTPNPCKHNGKCIVVNDEGFECACTGGWRGRNCEDYDPCFATPCLNGGSCTENTNGGFTCVCKKDYEGKYCGEEKVKAKPEAHWCSSQPCTNGGTCIDSNGAFTCRCRLGFSGPICEESVCLPNPCENAGTCVPYYGIALCKCTHDYTGAHCSDKRRVVVKEVAAPVIKDAATPYFKEVAAPVIKEVATPKPTSKAANAQYNFVPVAPVPIKPSTNLASVRSPMPTMPNAIKETKKDDPCDTMTCLHNGMCVTRTDGQPECICGTDFSGPQCREIGAYGYSSAPKFFPKDECNHCDEDAICVNGHCICKNMFVGDGLECWPKTDRDKDWNCEQNPCQNGGTCKYGRSKCVCRLGYTGDYCQNYCPPVVHLSFDKMQGALAKDESGNNNDAMLINGAEIVYEGGKCDSGVSLLGGDIIFDGERFWPKPVEAVTIALWVKLDTNRGIQSIFDTVGQKFSTHKEGQYHVEIENGKVRWFHRNEKHTVVFSIISAPLVGEGTWAHIAGTYDAQKSIAKLFVNGDLVAKGPGNGFLSQDWTGKAGIGKHEHPYGNRLLRGMVDEFYIFNCPLPRLEILVLMHHCKLYFGKKKVYSQSQKTQSQQPPKALSPPLQQTLPQTLSLPKPIGSDLKPTEASLAGLESLQVLGHALLKETSSPLLGSSPLPADHWVYHVNENVHVKGDAKAGISRPGDQANKQEVYQSNTRMHQNNAASRQLTNQRMPSAYAGHPVPSINRGNAYNIPAQSKTLVPKQQPRPWQPSSVFGGQRPVKKTLPRQVAVPSVMNNSPAWNIINSKKKQEDAKKKSFANQANQERIIEKMYQSLFSRPQQQQQQQQQQVGFIDQPSISNDLTSLGNARSSVVTGYAHQPQNPAQYTNQNSLMARQSVFPSPRAFATLPTQNVYPEYTSSESQKKNEINFLMRQNPMWATGDYKSSVPTPKRPVLQRQAKKPQLNYAQYTSIPAAMKPHSLALLPDPSELFFGKPLPKAPAKLAPIRKAAQPFLQRRYQSPNAIQNQMQRLRKAYEAKKRANAALARPKPNSLVDRLQNKWPKPNFVEEVATNRGVVRIQSITRPLPNQQPGRAVQRSPIPKNKFSYLKDPWSVYSRLKAQDAAKRAAANRAAANRAAANRAAANRAAARRAAAKRQGYQQADSHAETATSSNTLEGATAPGQQGAGHNYGYGYGYGTGNQLKGGGWGQGFGGGGPGENTAGTHHTPDFNNPKAQWSHGQGWGQGGKGVQQQTQYKPNPPAGSSFFPLSRKNVINFQQAQNIGNPSRGKRPFIAPKGPSILNFGPPSISNSPQMKQVDSRFSLRGSTPVSSPAYQVKYFASPNNGYIDDSDSARAMRNQIISNAIADALKSIQKKKRTTKGER